METPSCLEKLESAVAKLDGVWASLPVTPGDALWTRGDAYIFALIAMHRALLEALSPSPPALLGAPRVLAAALDEAHWAATEALEEYNRNTAALCDPNPLYQAIRELRIAALDSMRLEKPQHE